MPGHTYWRTITANRKSITKASSSLFDFSSMLPKLGETQARYVSPAARPAPASLPHRPLPVAPPLRPFPLPSAPSTPPRQPRRPSPLPSFPAGSALWLLPHTHTPHPYSIPLALGPLPRGRTPDPFRGVSVPAGSLLSRSLHSLTHAHPYPAPGASRSVLSSSHPHPTWPMGLSGAPDPSPLRVRELLTRNAGSLGACPVAHPAAGSGLGFRGSPGGEGRSPRASGLCKRRLRCPFPRNGGEGAAPRSVALSAGPESPSPVTAGSLEL